MPRLARSLLLAVAAALVAAPAASAQGPGPGGPFDIFLPLGLSVGEGVSRAGTDFAFLGVAGLTPTFVVDPDGDGEVDLPELPVEAPFPLGVEHEDLGGLSMVAVGGATFVNDRFRGDMKDRTGSLVCINGEDNRVIFGFRDKLSSGSTVYRILAAEDNATPDGTPSSAFGVRDVAAKRPDRLAAVATLTTKPPIDCGLPVPGKSLGGRITSGDIQVLTLGDTIGVVLR
jgi:hypothetical protein